MLNFTTNANNSGAETPQQTPPFEDLLKQELSALGLDQETNQSSDTDDAEETPKQPTVQPNLQNRVVLQGAINQIVQQYPQLQSVPNLVEATTTLLSQSGSDIDENTILFTMFALYGAHMAYEMANFQNRQQEAVRENPMSALPDDLQRTIKYYSEKWGIPEEELLYELLKEKGVI